MGFEGNSVSNASSAAAAVMSTAVTGCAATTT
jgi:hypothetical protein